MQPGGRSFVPVALNVEVLGMLAHARLDISLDKFTNGAEVFTTWTGDWDHPTFREILHHEDLALWYAAMDTEVVTLLAKFAFGHDLVDLPPGFKAMKLTWSFIIKRDAEGNVTKYKA